MKKYHLQNRPDREITSKEEVKEILRNGKFAVISMCRGNEPYIVTLSYGFDEEKNALYFHCSPIGLKLDFLRSNEHVCATVIEDGGYVANECSHNYRTLVFWGKMIPVETKEEKMHGMATLLKHLEKDAVVVDAKLAKAMYFYSKMEVLRLDITQIHGKAGR